MQEFRRMDSPAPREMLDLHAAGKPGRYNYIVRTRRSDRREQFLLADLPRYLVMLFLITERTRHAAAASV
jgi:hypothetical protein